MSYAALSACAGYDLFSLAWADIWVGIMILYILFHVPIKVISLSYMLGSKVLRQKYRYLFRVFFFFCLLGAICLVNVCIDLHLCMQCCISSSPWALRPHSYLVLFWACVILICSSCELDRYFPCVYLQFIRIHKSLLSILFLHFSFKVTLSDFHVSKTELV